MYIYIYIHIYIYIYMCVIYIYLVQTVSNKIYIIDYNWFAFQWLLQTYSVCFLFPSMLKKGGFEVSLSHQLKGSNLVLRGVQEGEATQCWKLDCRQSWTERCRLQLLLTSEIRVAYVLVKSKKKSWVMTANRNIELKYGKVKCWPHYTS